jgi:hypothetical protein
MQENEDLEEIVIVNSEEQAAWSDRLHKLFTPSLRQKVGYMEVQASVSFSHFNQALPGLQHVYHIRRF